MKKYILSFIGGTALLVAATVFVALFWCFNWGFYQEEFAKLDTPAKTGLSEEELDCAARSLLNYINGSSDDLGEAESILREVEILHMADVRELYSTAYALGVCSFIIGIILIVIEGIRNGRTILARGVMASSAFYVILIASIGVFAAVNFNAFWTAFHRLVFTNEMWLLEPTDMLVRIVEGRFFDDLVMRIAGNIMAIVLGCGIITGLMSGFRVRKK